MEASHTIGGVKCGMDVSTGRQPESRRLEAHPYVSIRHCGALRAVFFFFFLFFFLFFFFFFSADLALKDPKHSGVLLSGESGALSHRIGERPMSR